MKIEDLLRESELFRSLGRNELSLIAQSTRRESYDAGRLIVREGHVGRAMFLIVSGRVEVVRDIDKGRPQFVASLGPGDFFGEIASVKDMPRSASVRAIEETRCLVIWRADFDAFIAQFPAAAAKIEAAAKARLADSGQGDH